MRKEKETSETDRDRDIGGAYTDGQQGRGISRELRDRDREKQKETGKRRRD